MAGEAKQFSGRQLRVHLAERRFRVEPTDSEAVRKFLGGTGYACKLLYDELQPGIDPLGPDNKLVFATGPLCSNTIPGGGSVEVCFKSPATFGWGESRAGSDFGPDLRRAGYDHLIIEGRSDEPVYLVIQDDDVRFVPAAHLVGRTMGEKTDAIRKELGPGRFTVATIGPAGERLVRFAAVMFGDRAAGRCGGGAVMGSKNLLGIAVSGSRRLEPADPEAMKAAMQSARATLKENPNSIGMHEHGTMGDYANCDDKGDLPTKNWQSNSTGKGPDIFDTYEANNLIKPAPCYRGCLIACERRAQVKSGPYQTPDHGGAEYETMAVFTAYLMNEDVDAAVHAGYLCNQYGLDTISAGAVVAFAMECYEKGILTREQLGGLDLRWGNAEALPGILRLIALREGAGDILAEGVRLASKRLGRGSESFAIQIKGLEGPAHDGRSGKALALAYGTANRGMCHIHPLEAMAYDSNKMDWGMQKYGLPAPETVQRWSEQDKPPMVKLLQDALNLPEILCTCKFFMYAGLTIDNWADLLSAETGRAYTGRDLLEISERVINLQRMFNVREGFSAKDDQLPERVKAVPSFGKYQNEPQCGIHSYDTMLRDYYVARGWDPVTGIPTQECLQRLQIV
jgi:aldehyde:ferredoxin oxidoreductase